VRVGAALTTPGRVGTARRRGSGQRDEKVYARNQCLTPLNGPPAQIWRIWAGPRCVPDSAVRWRGTSGRDVTTGQEATVKICGVTVAMPQG
jgi:hypothetical protein